MALRTGAALCAAAAMLSLVAPSPCTAQIPAGKGDAPITLSGDYYFYSALKKNGQPACSERWRFADDGSATILSGEEVVTMRFHMENGDTLVWNDMQPSGGPDCNGLVRKTLPKEFRIYLYRGAAGDFVTCYPGQIPKVFGYILPASAVPTH